MKIAALSHLASPDAPTGAEKSLALLARGLVDRGHELAVVTPGEWCLAEGLSEEGIEVATISSRPCWLVQWGAQPLWKQTLRYLRYRWPDPGTRRLMVWLDHLWPDVVYVNCLPHLKGAEAARALGLPVVWHIREILPPGPRRRWFARRLERDATKIVAVSHAVAAWLADEGLGEKVTVVHNGSMVPPVTEDAEVLRAELGLPTQATLLGFFAQLVSHKGVSDLIAAGSSAMAESPDLEVVIAGDGPESDRRLFEAEIAAAPHPERFHVLPPVSDIWKLMAAVDIVAVPSRWPDPLPRTVMEAMAAGRPVVGYRTGGVPEMVVDGETGLLVEPGDVDGLARAIERLAGDPDLRRRFGAAAAKRGRGEFSLQKHVDRMEGILIACAESGSRCETASDDR